MSTHKCTNKMLMRKLEEVDEHILKAIGLMSDKSASRYVRRGNGMKGPKTCAMQEQLVAFQKFLTTHPVTGKITRIMRAHQCWLMHPEWISWAHEKGEKKGYSSHKSFAAAQY